MVGSTHKNLNTLYVNLSGLLKHLRLQKFVGRVHFEAKGYEADIFFADDLSIEARENDRIAGRVAAGEGVLPRILIRAHEPGGIIDVYDNAEISDAAIGQSIDAAEVNETGDLTPIPKPLGSEFEEIAEPAPKPISLKEKLGLPNLPFSFRKKRKKAEPEIAEPIEFDDPDLREWRELTELIGEILHTVEVCVQDASLNFTWVFDKVRSEVYEDFPFLHPNSTTFEYRDGVVLMNEQIDNDEFIAGIAESLSRLLGKFQTHPGYEEVKRTMNLNILELMNKHHAQYDKFQISSPLARIIES